MVETEYLRGKVVDDEIRGVREGWRLFEVLSFCERFCFCFECFGSYWRVIGRAILFII